MQVDTVLISTVEYDKLKAIERATSLGKQIRRFEPNRYYNGTPNDFTYWLVSDNDVLQKMQQTVDEYKSITQDANARVSRLNDELIIIKQKWWYKMFSK